ncbi:MAG: HD domain-containing protein, partial [Lachnospiraceae bacterium]|nr:HD domain-containing protein [Lachnospiraceae bacterium]
MDKVTYNTIKASKEIKVYINKGNDTLGVMGFTEHSTSHATKVAETAGSLLKELGYKDRLIELTKIAGYMHDIGNSINRHDHPHSGALMAFQILNKMEMDPEEIAIIVSAIGQHDEQTGTSTDPVSAALILADKTDVRRNRVRNPVISRFDKHDRVNYAAISSKLTVLKDKKVIRLTIELDEEICSLIDYFEIFLQRMLMCK